MTLNRTVAAIGLFLFSLWAADRPAPAASNHPDSRPPGEQASYDDWTLLAVPGTWDEHSQGALADYDGYAWYRCLVTIPGHWSERELELFVANVDNVHEAYVNGAKVGGAGVFPPEFRDGRDESVRHAVPAGAVTPGRDNLVAIRVYNRGGRGGFTGPAPVLISGDEAIALNGTWEFRIGDNVDWAQGPIALTNTAIFWRVMGTETALELARTPGIVEPDEAAATFTVPDDLEWELVLSEPTVRQPLFIDFDERGRMWVMQYIQYPYPAGLKMVSKDEYWRAVYDQVPPAPPGHFRGEDKITIHEDTTGDGRFDTHKTFVDGLSIASSFARGRGGVWVLNPPYLLFYPDRDHDDVPDGDPEVHLEGFGMQDTHSVANSLRWGPDGWLYAAQGSTVGANVARPGAEDAPVYSMGQLIWRYHPETRRYEIFAEGGGNAFGVEIDAQGRLYSGHNGGNTRGFHYVQGGYYEKGFSKHGPLSNPYAFGYFGAMRHHDVPRFTHNFVIYEAESLPPAYRGMLFGIEPLQGRVVQSEFSPDRSSFRTRDVGHPVTSTDSNFRPVDVKVGPDGAIYVADMYEPQISHREHFSGQIDKSTGRIYRLKAKGAPPIEPFDLGALSSRALVGLLAHPNKWHRQTALRLLGDRRDAAIVPLLEETIDGNVGRHALECLWALAQSGGLTEERALRFLDHEDEHVRAWTIRLLCDEEDVSSAVARKLAERAAGEPYVAVRSQLASSARRLPAADALPIARGLLDHSEDLEDVHLPLLLWWAIEAKAGPAAQPSGLPAIPAPPAEGRAPRADPEAVLALFEDPGVWQLPLVREHVLHRLMQRYAMAGSRQDLLVCARLFRLAPDDESSARLMRGFEEAFKGRSLSALPDELAAALAEAGGGSLVLGIRQGRPDAVAEALAAVADDATEKPLRLDYLQAFGEVDQPQCVPVLLELLERTADDELRRAALAALQRYADPEVAATVIDLYADLSADARAVAQSLLASRREWTRQLLEAVEAGRVARDSLPLDTVRQMTMHRDDRIAELVGRHWSSLDGASTAEMQEQIERHTAGLAAGAGDPYRGKQVYAQTCAKCHILFGEGGRIGPDLTSYKRDDTRHMLLHIVNPSAEIREGFETYIVLTEDGRTATGFLFDQDNRVVVLRGADGQNVTIARDEIEEMIPQQKSLMPEGLLNELTEQEVRDLFAYLRSSQPLNR